MSALDSSRFGADIANAFPQMRGDDLIKIRAVIAVFFWQWWVDHQRDTIIKKKLVFFTVTFKVRDLFPIFLVLFGNNPVPRVGE